MAFVYMGTLLLLGVYIFLNYILNFLALLSIRADP